MPATTTSRENWLEARKDLLQREKEFTKARDALSAARRDLPLVAVTKNYRFAGPSGEVSLGDLFGASSQLIVYHFMFGEDWEAGCKSCSFWADSFEGSEAHLAARDTAIALVSAGPLDKLLAFRKRMGWTLPWVSSGGSGFNEDFGVTIAEGEEDTYNFGTTRMGSGELPGLSVFLKKDDGSIWHSYSTYSRGLDILNATYNLLDMTPKGRDEQDLPYGMAWLQRHDEY